jgi:hypothetical protein
VRSPNHYDNTAFCVVADNGGTDTSAAADSLGVAPLFKV